MATPTSDYHRGEMDVHAQEETYSAVMTMTKWGALAIAVGVLFLTLWFCTPTGFLGAAATAIVVAIVGFLILKGGGGH